MNPKRHTPKHIVIKMSKVKAKGKNLKRRKRKTTYYVQGNPHKTNQISQQKAYRTEGSGIM